MSTPIHRGPIHSGIVGTPGAGVAGGEDKGFQQQTNGSGAVLLLRSVRSYQ
jgi:hypothetical protein